MMHGNSERLFQSHKPDNSLRRPLPIFHLPPLGRLCVCVCVCMPRTHTAKSFLAISHANPQVVAILHLCMIVFHLPSTLAISCPGCQWQQQQQQRFSLMDDTKRKRMMLHGKSIYYVNNSTMMSKQECHPSIQQKPLP